MKNRFLSLLVALILTTELFASRVPDEGMWLPMFVERLNYVDMQKEGLKLTPQEIYSINNSSLKDAIVNFGNFCTGEIVSAQGLVFTNHHCGYGAIQAHSSIEHDYLTDGFWARSLTEELPNEELTATFLVKMDDVTDRVLSEITDKTTEKERAKLVSEAIKKLKEEVSENGKYDVSIKSFFNGNEYYRFVYLIYKDVRLVGAPPSSIGKFGGDTDNWMWPRHTGDFSIFRIYANGDGSPADYSSANVPLKVEKFLKISTKGIKKDDYAMTWGFPGSTDRYRTSHGINATLTEINPAIIKLAGACLDVMKTDMDADPNIRIKYASHYASLANFWKNKIGETRGLKRLKVFDKKKKIEDDFIQWANQNEERKSKYGDVINIFKKEYDYVKDNNIATITWYFQMTFFGSQLMPWPLQVKSIVDILNSDKSKDEIQSALIPIKEMATKHFKDYNNSTEEKILSEILNIYRKDIPKEHLPDIFNVIDKKYKGDTKLFAKALFSKSVLASSEKFNKFIDNPKVKTFENDLAYKLTMSFYNTILSTNQMQAESQDNLKTAKRLFVDGLRKMNPDKAYYPDANFTMRVSYGQVLDYYPADAVHYDYITYADGILEKEDPTNDEFIVPAKLHELLVKKDFGKWAENNGRLPVCFISNNDITGGNSGSPVIDGNGNLIGIAFDGNWEAMSGDIAFEPELQRTISVDIRYVMFIIDKFANAQNIINELEFASN